MTKKTDNFKKVGAFLKELTPTEYRYMELTMQMVSGLNELRARFNLSEEDFCRLFKIKPSKQLDFAKGNYTYSLEDMVNLQCVYADLEHERLLATDLI